MIPTLISAAMVAVAAAVVVLLPVAAVTEWRNSRPGRGTLPLVGATPPPRRRVAGGPLSRLAARARAEAANLAGWRDHQQHVADELHLADWAWTTTQLPARRAMDGSPLWLPRPVL